MNAPGTPFGPDTHHRDDRGVSEVIAFILVFGIILTSVAFLSTIGFQAVEDFQENQRLNNAENGMVSLTDNLNDVLRYSGIEQRNGELNTRSGALATGTGGTEITEIDYGGIDLASDIDLGEFKYEDGTDAIVYEGGAVFRSASSGSAVLSQPLIRCSESRGTATVSLAAVDNPRNRSYQSPDVTDITMTVTDRERETRVEDSPQQVAIEFDSTPYGTAWAQAAQRSGWTWSSGTATCDDVTRVIVEIVTVTVSVDGTLDT